VPEGIELDRLGYMAWDGAIGENFVLDDAEHPDDVNGRAWAVLCNNTGT